MMIWDGLMRGFNSDLEMFRVVVSHKVCRAPCGFCIQTSCTASAVWILSL